MNTIIIMGRLTKDSDLTFTAGKGTAKLRFTVAVDDGFGDNKKTYFIPVSSWGKSAEGLSAILIRGTQVVIKGKLRYEAYDDKDGNKRWSTEVVADLFGGVKLCGSKGGNSAEYGTKPPSDDDLIPLSDDDMPF